MVIAGATGFIGHYLIEELLENTDFNIVALSRSPMKSHSDRIQCVQANLYSLLDCEKALVGCDVAIYLVHSMLPSSRLVQGNFSDFDFILADNFAKASKKNGVKKIIYVSGIIPPKERLSPHLASRLEVEETLKQDNFPLLSLRCGLVVGKKGSSFQIVERLIERLPILGLPQWTRNKLQIIYVKDLVHAIRNGIVDSITGSFDLGADEVIDYRYILKKVASVKKLNNRFINIPLMSPGLSKLWVRLVTGISGRLIFPLIDSLVHNMTVDQVRRVPDCLISEFTPVDKALEKSLMEDQYPSLPIERLKESENKESLVQSVQRLTCPEGWSSKDVSIAYMRWLPQFFYPIIKINRSEDLVKFCILGVSRPLLVLKFSQDRTFEGRDLFYITEGLLVKEKKSARLEFRKGPQQGFIIAALHNFRPKLPWVFYKLTQAPVHSFVMGRFGYWLKRQEKSGAPE